MAWPEKYGDTIRPGGLKHLLRIAAIPSAVPTPSDVFILGDKISLVLWGRACPTNSSEKSCPRSNSDYLDPARIRDVRFR
jgi:hypothetical protein